MRKLVMAGIAALAIAAPAAQGDPRPTGSSGTTCDHAGIASEAHHRKVDYLWQRYVGCHTAQHVARLWVHSCASTAFSGCSLNDHGKYWWCTAHAMSHHPGEYLATCNSNHDQIKIGWHR